MDESDLRTALADLPLGGLRFFERTGSTNDVALAWATDGAPDLALVCADEQTSGRGRGSRRWFSPPGSSLALSLVLRPKPAEMQHMAFFSGLGALAVADVLEGMGLRSEIKWPNDVLLRRRKVCGILVEAVWLGDKADSLVLGIGMNVSPESVPQSEKLNFPATCVDAEAGRPIDRLHLLHEVLAAILRWRAQLSTPAFLEAWGKRLAFRGEEVVLEADGMPARKGSLEGLAEDGGLRLRGPDGHPFTVKFGEVHLHPVV